MFMFTIRNSSCGKVMILYLSVILFTRGCVSQHALGREGCTPPGSYLPGQTPTPDTPFGRNPPASHTLGLHSPPATTAADSTHPTGMHSRLLCLYYLQEL